MREIVFDTETTGLSPKNGDRIVEIGCLELVNRLPTGETFHVYLNPERDMPAEAQAVHGLSEAFLADKPLFADVADDFLAFVGDAALIAHNASFDMRFIQAELKACGRPDLSEHQVIDTLAMARKKFPGSPASLDALCKRFNVDTSSRELHGALIDSELLAGVYLELMGGRQTGMIFEKKQQQEKDASGGLSPRQPKNRRAQPLPSRLSQDEKAAHVAFLEGFPRRAVWLAEEEAE